MSSLTLSELHVYPIKSAGGIALTTATVTARGLVDDRRWMVVNPEGQFLTQRQHPRMALIHVQRLATGLQVQAPHLPPLQIPDPAPIATRRSVQVWRDTCTAVEYGPEVNDWFSHMLQVPCQLVYIPENSDRQVADPHAAAHQPVSFADAYPFLLLSTASLADLNDRLETPLPMNRFRPNLVVSGGAAFAEDTWSMIRVGAVTFQVVKPCSRCIITTTDQTTATRHAEPLRTLATYRAWDGKIWFGQNLLPGALGTLQVGDRVEILA